MEKATRQKQTEQTQANKDQFYFIRQEIERKNERKEKSGRSVSSFTYCRFCVYFPCLLSSHVDIDRKGERKEERHKEMGVLCERDWKKKKQRTNKRPSSSSSSEIFALFQISSSNNKITRKIKYIHERKESTSSNSRHICAPRISSHSSLSLCAHLMEWRRYFRREREPLRLNCFERNCLWNFHDLNGT